MNLQQSIFVHDRNVILTAIGILLEGRSSLQMCGEFIIDNLEDFFCYMTVLTVPLREGAQLINWGSLTQTNVTCFSREGETPCFIQISVQESSANFCSSREVQLFEQLGRIFLCPRISLDVIAACFFQHFNHFINLTLSICVLKRKSQLNINFYLRGF